MRTQCALASPCAAGVLILSAASLACAAPANPGGHPPSRVPRSQEPTAEIRVQGSRPAPPAPVDPVELFDADFITRTDAFTADEVLAQLTVSLPGTQQVVLINGRETLEDISTIPADRIERIEVSTTGVMPDGRPRVLGSVINIILKESYNGANVSARQRDSFAGGGGQSQLNAWGGYTLSKLSGFVNLTHREQDTLLASDRDFSQQQDHTAVGGADYRAPYGTVPVVQAVSGSLNGITDSNGSPVSIALAPEVPPSGGLTPDDFIPAPAGTVRAAGLRHFNTSDFLYLAAPSKTNGVNGELAYALTPDTKLRVGYSYARAESQQSAPPPITRVSSLSIVPAAYNPFGQDVEVGLVHSGFGAVQRDTSLDRRSGFFSADGHFADTWTWTGRFEVNRRVSTSDTHDLDPAKFAASLAAADPAERFDPFADTGPGSRNAALYPSLTSVRESMGTSEDTKVRAESRGQVSEGWIAPLFLRMGVERRINDSRQNVDSGTFAGADVDTRNRLSSLRVNANLDVPAFRVRELEPPAVLSFATYVTRDQQRLSSRAATTARSERLDVSTLALNSFLNVPWIAPADAWRGTYELQTQFGVGLARADGTTDITENLGAIWSPVKALTLRADYSRQQAPVPAALYPVTLDYNQTLIDRRRANPLADNVDVISNQPDAQRPPFVTRLQLSAQWVPPSFAKLRLMLTYSAVNQEGQQRTFSAQDILDNEAALAGRVTRLPPTPDDIAAGQPGEIVQVDITPFSGGRREDRSLAFVAQYTNTIPEIGTMTFRGNVQRLLHSNNELIAGIPIVSTNDQEVPPAWNGSAQADWQLGKWRAGSSFTYLSGGRYAGVPYASFGTLDARVMYQIDRPFGGHLARTLRIGAGIQNLLNRDPPFANTLTGFRGGSPLGRTYELTLRAPLGG